MRDLMIPCVATLMLAVLYPGETSKASGRPELELKTSDARVGRYEMIEFVVRTDAPHQNPFDPTQIDMTLRVTAPSGARRSVPVFFIQEFQRRRVTRGGRETDWLYAHGFAGWKARFAPAELGTYRAVVCLKSSGLEVESDAVQFECGPSEEQGFVRLGKNDPRFFAFDSGDPFFPVGQNVAYVDPVKYVDLTKADDLFRRLSDNGANFSRVWTCCEDWGMAVEAGKSAWGRSWGHSSAIVPLPESDGQQVDANGQCVKLDGADGTTLAIQPTRPLALLPDTRYTISGRVRVDGDGGLQLDVHRSKFEPVAPGGTAGRWVEFRHEFTTRPGDFWLGQSLFRLNGAGVAWIGGVSLRESVGGPELLGEADPNRPALGVYHQFDCFMLDEIVRTAEARGVYLMLCLLTRDLYMPSLRDANSPQYDRAMRDAKNFMRYAVARWGHSPHVMAWEYFNEVNPGLPTDRFYAELADYLDEVDPYRHLRTTSTWAPSTKDCRHPRLDIAQVHYYFRPGDERRLDDEVAAVVDRAQFLRRHAPDKPALIGEFGLATARWGLSDSMKTDEKLVHFHNALWASALSGVSGTAAFWWWETLDSMDAYPHYRPLARFLADVPFSTVRLETTQATVSSPAVCLVGLQGPRRAYLWLFNPQAAWANPSAREVAPRVIRGAIIEIPNLPPGEYRVQWWNTREGRVTEERAYSISEEPAALPAPTFSRDVACKIVPAGGQGRKPTTAL